MTFQGTRKVQTQQELDRVTWAQPSLLIMSYDTVGTGAFLTETLAFGMVFEGQPFFSYGVELLPGEILIEGEYPGVMCGVREWNQTENETETTAASNFYIGAALWMEVVTAVSYKLRFRLSFEGIAMRNVEHFL